MMELIGVLLPPLIDLINRKVAQSDARFWVSVVVCSLFGIVINFVQGDGFHYATMLAGVEAVSKTILIVFGIAQLVYKGAYEDSRLQKDIRLER